jgi:hypothetical protein
MRPTAAFDATDSAPLERFFRDLSAPIDHVMVTAAVTAPLRTRWGDTDTACRMR